VEVVEAKHELAAPGTNMNWQHRAMLFLPRHA